MNTGIPIRFLLGSILITLIAMEVYYLLRMRSTTSSEDEEVHDNKVGASLSAALIDLGLILAVVYVIQPEWMASTGFEVPVWVRWLGSGLALAGLVLRGWAHMALGNEYAWYMRIQPAHQLVTTGPYQYIRHPMYTAALSLTAGIAVGTANWLIGALLILPAVLTLAWRLDAEEAMLLEKFGDDYRAYQRHTGRLLPRW